MSSPPSAVIASIVVESIGCGPKIATMPPLAMGEG
jgi:hypothetical protein